MRDALGAILAVHRHDTMSQDSGNHCICGSDSRYEQKDWDHPWETFGQHLADVALQAMGDVFEENMLLRRLGAGNAKLTKVSKVCDSTFEGK